MSIKQPELDGVGKVEVKQIEEVAEEYVRVRDARMDLTKKEVSARNRLLDLMHEHKLQTYEYDEHVVEITQKEKIKVKKAGADEDAEDADDDDAAE